MKIGKYVLRKPWTKYVEIPIEEQLYWEIRRSISQDIVDDLINALHDDCKHLPQIIKTIDGQNDSKSN